MQGKQINGFILKHPLGEGGMAEVRYAENMIGKKSAVKLLLPKFCQDEDIVERFQNEAKVMVQLDHPNIRQVYDYGSIEGRPAIVMEYLEGNDLKAIMNSGRRFTDVELQKWWNQIADALNDTHSKGIVHRDIKPSNIFIDSKGDVRLLDFGIAKIKEGITMTQTGALMGTLIYMSPEQVRDSKHIDYRTDVYSLAVTFVHLLSGRAPYDTNSFDDYTIRKGIVEQPLDMTGVPASWRQFLEPYLAKDPQQRPALVQFGGQQATVVSEPRVENTSDIFIRVGNHTIYMVYVKGGTFTMGCTDEQCGDCEDDEMPAHPVTLEDYYIGMFEVTQGLWDEVMGYNPSFFRGYDSLPVERVSWVDCMEFIRKLNKRTGKHFRFPTEAEWEYAARGGNKSKGYKYSGSNNFNDVAWNYDNSESNTHSVGTKRPNELGIYDMSGNVMEWCSDWWGNYTAVSQTNPTGPYTGTYRVLRGGSWFNYARRCRVSFRYSINPDDRLSYYGLRLALSK